MWLRKRLSHLVISTVFRGCLQTWKALKHALQYRSIKQTLDHFDKATFLLQTFLEDMTYFVSVLFKMIAHLKWPRGVEEHHPLHVYLQNVFIKFISVLQTARLRFGYSCLRLCSIFYMIYSYEAAYEAF